MAWKLMPGHVRANLKKSFPPLVILIFLPGWFFSDELPTAESFYLNNGMHVVVIENHIVPAVTQMLVYKIGAAHEPKGKSGIAHVLEHMLFKSTDKLESGEFSKIVAQHGGNDNAYTTQDITAYHQSIAKDELELVMELEADRMRNLKFTEEEFAKEIQVVLEERNMRIENSPRNILIEKLLAAIFPNHPYGNPVIGHEEEIRNLSTEDAYSFYKQYYSPNNAVLIVSGDITAQELKPLAEKHYGHIQAQEFSKTHIPDKLPENKIDERIIHTDDKVQEPELIFYYKVPSLNTDKAEYTYPLVLLSHILGSGNTSILYQSLVSGQEIAAHASASYDDMALGPSIFNLYLIPIQNVPIEKLAKAVNEEILKLLKNGIEKEDLERAKNELVTAAIYARDGIAPLANIFGEVVGTGIDPGYVDDWEDNINDVTIDDVNKAIKLLFNESQKVTGILLPES